MRTFSRVCIHIYTHTRIHIHTIRTKITSERKEYFHDGNLYSEVVARCVIIVIIVHNKIKVSTVCNRNAFPKKIFCSFYVSYFFFNISQNCNYFSKHYFLKHYLKTSIKAIYSMSLICYNDN